MHRLLSFTALLALAFISSSDAHGFFRPNFFDSIDAANELVGDVELTRDDALFLTPYIEAGKLAEGRNLSEVKNLPNGGAQVKSFSGFLTVNKKYNSNIFFWFFPALVSFATA